MEIDEIRKAIETDEALNHWSLGQTINAIEILLGEIGELKGRTIELNIRLGDLQKRYHQEIADHDKTKRAGLLSRLASWARRR